MCLFTNWQDHGFYFDKYFHMYFNSRNVKIGSYLLSKNALRPSENQ